MQLLLAGWEAWLNPKGKLRLHGGMAGWAARFSRMPNALTVGIIYL